MSGLIYFILGISIGGSFGAMLMALFQINRPSEQEKAEDKKHSLPEEKT